MKTLFSLFAFVCLALGFSMDAHAQNLATVSASNIQDINGAKLAAGQVCFLITDQNDTPISVQIGGGGQALKRGYCSPVVNGVVTGFTVPNPANTLPSGIYYRVTVKDTSTGQEVLRYTQVSFTGATFNFDGYAPLNLAAPAPLSGTSVTGNLSVTGNVAATGTVIGSNIPGSIPGAGTCTNQFVRTLTSGAPPTCATVGSSDLAASLSLTTPNIGAATGTSAVVSGILASTGSTGLPVATSGSLYMAGGFGSPHLGKIFVGDGTGWQLDFSKRVGSVTTDLLSLKDNGQISFLTSSGTLPATIANDTAGGILFTTNGAKQIQIGNTTGHLFLTAPGSAAFFFGSTSGNVSLQAPAVAGSNNLVLPAASDTLVGKATTDTLTNKTIGAGGLAGLTPAFQQFTSSGTFTIPAGITAVKVTVVGGGGAGGGGGATTSAAGCGGNSGGTSIKWLSGLTPGNTLAVTIGAGGTGNSNANGNSGGSSTVASGTQTISTITGSGGVGGTGPGGVGTNPTAGSGGDMNFAGNAGTLAPVSSAIAGNGGGAIFGGGGLGAFSTASGNAGTSPGAGGGGGGANGGNNTTGGAGAAGIVIFEWVK